MGEISGHRPALGREFVTEARGLLETAETGAMAWVSDPLNEEHLNALLRPLHTLKGTAGLLNLVPVAGLTHALESLLAGCRDESRAAGKSRSTDGEGRGAAPLEAWKGSASQQLHPDTAPERRSPTRRVVDGQNHAGSETGAPAATGCAPSQPALDLLLDSLALLRLLVGELEAGESPGVFSMPLVQAAEALRVQLLVAAAQGPVMDAAPAAGAERRMPVRREAAGGAQPAEMEFRAPALIRVEGRRLERFLETFGRWQTAQAALAQSASFAGRVTSEEFSRQFHQLHELSREVEAAAGALRRTTLRRTFEKLEWLAQTLAPRLGKTARLEAEGHEVELEVEAAAELDGILLHLARNALDHGLETPAARRAAGKAETGTIRVAARCLEDNLVIELRDDGAGLDRRKIQERALAQGLAEAGADLSNAELQELVFRTGFSTAEAATEISGRGLGLAAVKRAIQNLDGVLELESSPGAGTTFQIYLPRSKAKPVRAGEFHSSQAPPADTAPVAQTFLSAIGAREKVEPES